MDLKQAKLYKTICYFSQTL